jgi:hypothetical protein
MQVLKKYSLKGAAWIETGTYEGSTTKYLAKRFPKVITIEPAEIYFRKASARLANFKNVQILFGTSQLMFKEALHLTSENLNVWLDGHYSNGETFLSDTVTPILSELLTISDLRDNYASIVVFIDDIRLFGSDDRPNAEYPDFSALTNWCEDNDFTWKVSRDILIAKFLR